MGATTLDETVKQVEEEQKRSAPDDDLAAYVDQWVAIRAGKVIAAASTPAQLRDNPSVRKSDTLMLVTNEEAAYLVV